MSSKSISSGVLLLGCLICIDAQPVFVAATEVVLRAADAGLVRGTWRVTSDTTAAGGSALSTPNLGVARLTTPLASPANYFELQFQADAGTPYRLWLRGKAERNSTGNDSVFVQFSDSVTSTGTPEWRIGTTSATTVILADCSACSVAGWGWQDNGYGTGKLGPLVHFQNSGTHTVRIQVREDGMAIDQIVFSPAKYLNAAPGAIKNDQTILTGGTTAPPATISLVRQPYLQQVFDRSAVIVWASREPGPASARVGSQTSAASTTYVPSSATGLAFSYYQHEAAVSGLAPATTYAYDVFVGGVAASSGTDRLTTAPSAPSGSVRFIAFGDSGTGSSQQKMLAGVMNSDTFHLALHTGDIAYGNTGGTGDASYATYQSWFFEIYKNWLRRRPFFPSMGNHDSRLGTGWGKAYLDLFVLPDEAGASAYPDNAERYYSFDYGPVHFIALDTERAFQDTNRRAIQLAWLDADLAATSQPWKIAFFHRSPYSGGGEHGSDVAVRQAFGPLFEKHGVQLVLSAHEHVYERSVPWRVSTDSQKQAVTYVVTGGGGGPLYSTGTDAWTAKAVATHHYTRVNVSGCVATLEAVGTTGAVFDQWSLNRCEQASDAAPPAIRFVTPTSGSTVSGTLTVEADAFDDVRVEKVDLWIDGRQRGIDTTAPYTFAWDTRADSPGAHTLELRAYDIDGNRVVRTATVTVGTPVTAEPDIVIRAADVSPSSVFGNWYFMSDSTAADGVRLSTRNLGVKATASASPSSYFDVTFLAQAGTPYHLWLRMKAAENHWSNDSVYVQFDRSATSSGTAVYRIGSSNAATVTLTDGSGASVHNWGWNDNGFAGLGGHIYFAESGLQKLRIQMREDGASVDQIVISPGRYLTVSPGQLKDDTTIVAR